MTEVGQTRSAGDVGILRRVFAVDVRSLAALRIALACIVLVDIATRLPLLAEFYTDAGLLPRPFVPFDAQTAPFAFHMRGGSEAFELGLSGVGFAAALGMLVGWQTRLCTTLVYLHQLSLFWRNPLVLNGGDYLMVWLLFWCVFLPLGARWALDVRRRETVCCGSVFSFASAGVLVQLAGLYFFSVFHKVRGEGWLDGTAVFFAVSHELHERALGVFLSGFPGLLHGLTWAVLAWEAVGSLLLLSPFATLACRLVAIAGFAALQLGLGVSMQLWLFPWVSTAGLLPFVPPAVWDAIARRLGAAGGTRPFTAPRPLPWLVAWLPALALGYILYSNVERLQDWSPPHWLSRGGRILGLNQGPSMFSTRRAYDVDLQVVGSFGDGRRRLLDDGHTRQWPGLIPVRSRYRGAQYLENLAERGRRPQQRGLALWVCRHWNAVQSERLAEVSLFRLRHSIEPDGAPSRSLREELFSMRCPQSAEQPRRPEREPPIGQP